jgi:hypothetical protein
MHVRLQVEIPMFSVTTLGGASLGTEILTL